MWDREVAIRRTCVPSGEAREIANALYSSLDGATAAVVVVFAPPDVDRESLRSALGDRFGEVPVVGCTTAGQIGPQGVGSEGIVGFSLPKSHFTVAIRRVERLEQFTLADGAAVASELLRDLEAQCVQPSPAETFALLLVDGLSAREELVASALDGALGGIALFGGSAGDGLRFRETAVLAEGRFAPDAAVVLLVHTSLPFRVFKSQHVAATERKLVVTAADTHTRIVQELDGEPAAEVYARAVGVPVGELSPDIFAAHPVVVRVGGTTYVRSIRQCQADGSLAFFCAIDEGLVLSLAVGGDLVDSLRSTLEDLRHELGPLRLLIGCDCILRRLEAARLDLNGRLDQLFAEHAAVGFGTYGEQYRGVHVNQTFTGVAIGSARRDAA